MTERFVPPGGEEPVLLLNPGLINVSRGVAEALVPIVVLCLEIALAFFFAFWAFLRMDLTGNE